MHDPQPSAPGSRNVHRTLLLILFGALLLRILLPVGTRTIDHFLYVEYAKEIVDGTFEPQPNAQATRPGILLPLAALQFLFGIGEASALLYFVLGSIGGIWLAYRIGSLLFDPRSGLIAAALLSVMPLDLIHATLPYPDIVSSFFLWWGVVIFWEAERRDAPGGTTYLFSGLVLGWATLCKRSAVFALPLLAVLVLRNRRWRRGHLAAAGGFAAMLAFEAILYAHWSGRPFFVFETSSVIAAIDIRPHYFPTTQDLVNRMTWELPALLFFPFHPRSTYFVFYAWLALPAVWFLRKHDETRPLLWILTTLFLSIWGWPITLSPFTPALIADPRHLIPLALPICILVAAWIRNLPPRRALIAGSAILLPAIASSLFIRDYLKSYDAGDREAFEQLQSRDVKKIALSDGRALFRYLSRYDPSCEIRPLYADDLDTLRGFHVVLDSRFFLRESRTDPTRRYLPDLAARLEGWKEVWSEEREERTNPMQRLRGIPPPRYVVKIYARP